MKIKITPANAEAINAALAAVNGKAHSFTIDSALTVLNVAKEAENNLTAGCVTLKNRPGTTVYYHPSGPSARAYDAGAISTEITIVRGSKDWFLTNVERVTVWPRQAEKFRTLISFAARDDIVREATKRFNVAVVEEL
jgi:hypothetical protein